MALTLSQTHFRFGYDDGTESGHTFRASEDTNVTISEGQTFLLRFKIQESGASAGNNLALQFQYNKDGAGWVNITTTSAVVRALPVAAFANGADCTARLTGTGTFVTNNDGCTEDGTSGGSNNDVASNGNTETECALQVVAGTTSAGSVIQFRLTVSGPTTTIIYSVTPSLTVGTPVSFPSTPVLDDFNRADAGNLGPDWTDGLNGNDGVSNTVKGQNAGWNITSWDDVPLTADNEVYITLATIVDGDKAGVYLRWDGGAGSGYGVTAHAISGDHQINMYRTDGFTDTSLGILRGFTFASGDKLGMSIVGSVISVFYKDGAGDWKLVGQFTDTTYSNIGLMEILTFGTSVRLDDFGGGDIVTSIPASSERVLRTYGKQGTNSERLVRALGKTTASSERLLRLIGKDTAISERLLRVSGWDTGSSERAVHILGIEGGNSERGIYLAGKSLSQSEVGLHLVGVTIGASERLIRVLGYDEEGSDRGVLLLGKGVSSSERALRITSVVGASSERLIRLLGKQLSSSERGIYILGEISSGTEASSERGIFISGKQNGLVEDFSISNVGGVSVSVGEIVTGVGISIGNIRVGVEKT